MLTTKLALAFWASWMTWSIALVWGERACPGDAGDGSWCYTVPDNWIVNTTLDIQLDGNIPSSGVTIQVHKVSLWPNGSTHHEFVGVWSPYPSDPLLVTWIVNQSVGSSMHAHFAVGSDPMVTSATHVIEDAAGNTDATTTYTVATGYSTSTAAANASMSNSSGSSDKKSGVSIGVVIGAVAAGVAIVLIVAGIFLYHRRAVKKARRDGRKSVVSGGEYDGSAGSGGSGAGRGHKYNSSDGRPEVISYDSYGSQYSGHGPHNQHMSSIQPYPTSLTHAALAVNNSQHGSGMSHHTPEPSERFSERIPPPSPPHAVQYHQPQPIAPGAASPDSDPRYSVQSSTPSANDHIAALTTSVTNSVLQQLASLHLASQRNTAGSLGPVHEDGPLQGAGAFGANAGSRPVTAGTATEGSYQNAAGSSQRHSTISSAHHLNSGGFVTPSGGPGSDSGLQAAHQGDSKQEYNTMGMHVTNPNDSRQEIITHGRPEPSTSLPLPPGATRAMSVTSMGTAPPLYRER